MNLLSCDLMSPFNEFLLNHSMISLLMLVWLVPGFLGLSLLVLVGQFIWLFMFLAGLNFLGLTPYSWTVTLYPVLTVLAALLFWSLTGLNNLFVLNVKWGDRSLAHYLPLSTPIFLWIILPMIEVVSQLIRPVTLSVRLTANLIAGHVLIFLVSQLGGSGGSLFLVLIPFEMMVAMVQGYVFVMLLDSYSLER